MWARWQMTIFGSVLRHSSLQTAAVNRGFIYGARSPSVCVLACVPDVGVSCMSHVVFYGEGCECAVCVVR